jgi:predicted DNA-binding transcriptional regulator YafY
MRAGGPIRMKTATKARSRPEDPFALNLARIVHRLLTNPRGWEVEELKGELAISDRTYRKYRQTLQERFGAFMTRGGESAVREVKDGDSRYLRLVEGGELDAASDDLLATISSLHLAREAFRFLSGTEMERALDAIYASVRERVGDKKFVLGHLFRNLDRMLHCVEDAPKDYRAQGEKLRALVEGLIFTRRIALDYKGAGGERRHELEPLTLMMHRGALYLLGRHEGDERVYSFAVDRIAKVELLAGHFRYPKLTQFDPAEHFEGAFGIFVPPEAARKRVDVELVFANERWLKLYVQERRWHRTQALTELKDGRLRMKFQVNSMVEVWPWIRSFGSDVTVVKPRRTGV